MTTRTWILTASNGVGLSGIGASSVYQRVMHKQWGPRPMNQSASEVIFSDAESWISSFRLGSECCAR